MTGGLATITEPPHGQLATFQSQSLTGDQIDLIKRTIARDTTDDELGLFVQVCNRTQLDPFARQIYAVKRYDASQRREVMQIQVGIDGFRLIAERTGRYLGRKSIEWCGPDGHWLDVWLSDEPPAAARCTVQKLGPGGMVVDTPAVVHFREYSQTKSDGALTRMWATMPANQLGKCAEAQALRSAFPAELSGLYTPEEMDQAGPALQLLPPEGFATTDEAQAAHRAMAARIKALPDEQRAKTTAWRDQHEAPWPMSAGLLAELGDYVDRVIAGTDDEPEPDGSPFDDAIDVDVVDDGQEPGAAEATATPPASDVVTSRRAQAIHKEAGDLAKLLGHTNSRGGGDSKWADAVLDALILEVTGGRTSSAGEITVTEDSKLGHRMVELADGAFDTSVAPDFSTVSLHQLSSGRFLYFGRDDQGVMQYLPDEPEVQ